MTWTIYETATACSASRLSGFRPAETSTWTVVLDQVLRGPAHDATPLTSTTVDPDLLLGPLSERYTSEIGFKGLAGRLLQQA